MELTAQANALRAIRKRHGLSQEALARLVERTPGAIAALETNRLALSDELFDLIVSRAQLTDDEAHALEMARSGIEPELGEPVAPPSGPTLAERVAELEARMAALEERFPTTERGYLMAADTDPARKGTGRRKRRPSPPAQS